MLRFVVAMVVLLLAVAPGVARADSYPGARMTTLHVEGAPGVRLHVKASCSEESCSLTHRWTVSGSNDVRDAVIEVGPGEVQSLTVDGGELGYSVDAAGRVTFALPFGEAPLELEMVTLVPLLDDTRGCSLSSYYLADARHPFRTRTEYWLRLDGEIYGEEIPAVVHTAEVTLEVEYPRKWRVRRSWRPIERAGERSRVRYATRNPGFVATVHRVVHGPAVAAGVQLRGRRARPWLRAGWEFSTVEFLMHSFAAETDLRSLTLVPSTEIGTPSLLILPPVSFGVGLPVRVLPSVRPGARAQMAFNFPIVSLVGGYDVFPPMGGRPIEHYGRVGVQASF